MRSLALLALAALPLGAQATSQRRIPVGKEHAPAKPHVDTVRIVVHDTVVVHHTDTLSVFKTATLPPAAPPAEHDSASCSNRYIPIPIPIPIPRGHGAGSGAGATPPTTATPEPGTIALVGTGFAALVWFRRRGAR
jgi:hypothetical protein